jgi:serine/threonine-protein kinase SMG1
VPGGERSAAADAIDGAAAVAMQNPRPSYAHHQLQQHLSSLLSAASGEPPHPSDDSARAAALSNLRLAFLHPPNRPLLPSIAPFLAQPLSVLLADDA